MDASKIFAVLIAPLLFAGKQHATLVIKQGNKEILRKRITKADNKIFKVRLFIGYTAEIVVSEGRAWIKRMPNWVCPKHICSDMGKIDFEGDKKIVCAPNKLVIYFEK